MGTRPGVDRVDVLDAVNDLMEKLTKRLNEKGNGSFSSKHEILGVLEEEFHELVDSVRKHGDTSEEIIQELLDIAVGAIFGVACIKTKKVDW